MNDDIAIQVNNVSKSFVLPHEKANSLKGAFLGSFKGGRSFEKQKVLKNISFTVKKGEFFGVVGRNGSGKSTLLKLLAGIYEPNQGSITINGKLTPFIELGVGFNPELTGKENVFLNGALLGFSRKEMLGLYDKIVSFAELEKFMDQKLKNYSSGMQVRLAFSIAIRTSTDILVLDEVLAVGDASFQKKCFEYFRSLKQHNQTVVFISHDMNAVREYCDKGILLEGGKIVCSGSSDKISSEYTKLFQKDKKNHSTHTSSRWGTGAVKIMPPNIVVTNERIVIKATVRFNEKTVNPIFGTTIINPFGHRIFEANTKWDKINTTVKDKNEIEQIEWSVPNIFTNGLHIVNLAVANQDASEFYDWWEGAGSFNIDKDAVTTAITLPNHQFKFG